MDVVGREPNDKAELELYKYLENISVKGTSWFNLDIPGTHEIDCLAWFDEIGFFIIEVKGYRIGDFKTITLDNIQFTNNIHQTRYGHKPPPWKQSRQASRIIATYLTNIFFHKNIFDKRKFRKNDCIPYVDSTVYFPFINESEFSANFPNVSETLKDYIIFNDCHGSEEYLKSKLKKVIHNRIANIDAEYNKSSKLLNYDVLIDIYKKSVFLSLPENTLEEKYDFKLLKLLENSDLTKEINTIDFKYPVYRYGYAGTGKTVIALRILQHLAIQEKNVLFTCYNKVLASDLKRLNKLSYNNALKFFDFITVKDIHDLIIEYSPFGKIISNGNVGSINDKFFEDIVDGIISSNYFKGVFEFIVIDEAQDLKDYGWKLLYYLSKNGENSLIVLNGKEQNLYLDSPSIFLKKFEDNIKRINSERNLNGNLKQKKRIYRNKTRTFLFAHSFLDYYPETSLAIDFIIKNEAKKDSTIEFDRNLGNFPFVIKRNENTMRDALRKAIQHCLKENKNHGLGESGILIVVPWKFSKKFPKYSFYRNMAVSLLKELNVDFIDYTIEENRRLDYLINQVRIVSFHSCRGIEANFSLILGFEELFDLSEKAKCDYHKLGYIILSRAKYETYIFIDESKKVLEASRFLNYSNSIYSHISPDEKFIY
jgi:hypothetical protein